jgi:hypothetical protein
MTGYRLSPVVIAQISATTGSKLRKRLAGLCAIPGPDEVVSAFITVINAELQRRGSARHELRMSDFTDAPAEAVDLAADQDTITWIIEDATGKPVAAIVPAEVAEAYMRRFTP